MADEQPTPEGRTLKGLSTRLARFERYVHAAAGRGGLDPAEYRRIRRDLERLGELLEDLREEDGA